MTGSSNCCVRGCRNTIRTRKIKPDLIFHAFPFRNKALSLEWINKCQNYQVVSVVNERVCSEHFTPDDYLRDLKHELLNLPLRRRLKPEAVPSILPTTEEVQVAIANITKKNCYKSRCLLCGRKDRPTINSNNTDEPKGKKRKRRPNDKDKETFQAWDDSCAYSIWKLLDVGDMFQNFFRRADYCNSCRLLTRDIDFSVKALARIQEQLQKCRDSAIDLLKKNFEALETEFGVESFMYGSVKFHGMNSYGQTIKTLCETLAIPERDPATPQIVSVVSNHEDEKRNRSTAFVTRDIVGFVRNDSQPVEIIDLIPPPPPLKPAPTIKTSQNPPVLPIVSDPEPVPAPTVSVFVNRLRKQIYMTSKIKRQLNLIKPTADTSGEDEYEDGDAHYVDDDIEIIEYIPETTANPTPITLINVEDDELPITIFPKGHAPVASRPRTQPRILKSKQKQMLVLKPRVKKVRIPKTPKEQLPCTFENCTFKAYSELRVQTHFRQFHVKDCLHCGTHFHSTNVLRAHEGRCNKEPTVPCAQSDCTKKFYTEKQMRGHYRSKHSDEAILKCQICTFKFPQNDEEELAKHVELHKMKKEANTPSACVFVNCKSVFICALDLRQHVLRQHDATTIKCLDPDCDAVFTKEKSRELHARKKHNVAGLKCRQPGCSYVAKSSNELKNGTCPPCRTRNQFLCKTCGRGFSFKSYLTKHVLRVHQGGVRKLYKCSYANCEKSFSTSTSFRSHEEHHTPYRPYLCDLCSAAFKSKKNLLKHFAIHKRSEHETTSDGAKIKRTRKRRPGSPPKTHRKARGRAT